MPNAPRKLKTLSQGGKRSDYNRAWERKSKEVRRLRKIEAADNDEAQCVECAEDGEPFRMLGPRQLHVDHIIPVSVAPHLRLVDSNLQVLCRTHHNRKTRGDQ